MKRIIYLAVSFLLSSQLLAQSSTESNKIEEKPGKFTKEGGIIKIGNSYFRTKMITNKTYPLGLARVLEINKTWNGSQNPDWQNGLNWTPNGVPSTLDNVLIPTGTLFSAVIANGIIGLCNYLKVDAGATMTVNTGGTLNIEL